MKRAASTVRRLISLAGLVSCAAALHGCCNSQLFGVTPKGCVSQGAETASGATFVLAPPPGDFEDAIDTLVWVEHIAPQAGDDAGAELPVIQLTGPEGPVEGTTSTLALAGSSHETLIIFHPAALLTPETTFSVTAGKATSSFTTGVAILTGAPAAPTVTQQILMPNCSPDDIALFTVNNQGVLAVEQLEGQESAFNVATLSGQVADAQGPQGLRTFELIDGPCGNWNGGPLHLRFGVLDTAGQFSGWTDWFYASASLL